MLRATVVIVTIIVGARATTAGEVCGTGDPEAICAAPRVELAGARTPQDGPIIGANTTYAVAGAVPGQPSYLVYHPQVTAEYTLYVGGPPVTAGVCNELPTCAGPAPTSCMRMVATYVLVGGERYEIELGPIGAGKRVAVHLSVPEDEELLAVRDQRVIDAGTGVSAVRFDDPSTYSTASVHDRLSYAISESRSLNTSGHSRSQRRLSSAPAPDLHEM
jgi:hypothetical protein